MTDPISATAPQALAAAHPKDDPAKVASAAKQFEALLIGQMMKSMHDAEGGEDEDESASSAMDYGREVFAQAMAANGGFGLAAMIAKGLQPPPSA
jgi:Rod binding domain-containing protein